MQSRTPMGGSRGQGVDDGYVWVEFGPKTHWLLESEGGIQAAGVNY